MQSPARWGTEEGFRELFGTRIASLQVTLCNIAMRYASPHHCIEHYRAYFGPIITAFAALNIERQEQLMDEMVQAAQSFNRSGDATLVVPCDDLEVVVVTCGNA